MLQEPGPTATLFLVATPIGHLGDITLRALEVLRSVSVLACEDTRRTHKLLSHHGIPRPTHFLACHEHNERRVVARILGLLEQGLDVALCSDAGTPLISDPGFVLAREVRARGLRVEVIPGPSAVSTAILASGLPSHAWAFLGFAPRKPGPRRRFLAEHRRASLSLVLFESPERLPSFLATAQEVFGAEREVALCVELTKRFERVLRGPLHEIAERVSQERILGELCVVIAPAPRARRAKGDEE
jgi:16S rRNA (cytidine1402-2'-O)-methyltransferase